MGERTHHRIWREATERAERSEFHGVAEICKYGEVLGPILAGNDAVERLHAARRTDPARRALAARFDGAELHREARLPCHVDGVVKHHDAAVPDKAVADGERLVVER